MPEVLTVKKWEKRPSDDGGRWGVDAKVALNQGVRRLGGRRKVIG